MADDAAGDRVDEELVFLIDARTKRARFLEAKANRNSHDPESAEEIEYQTARADWAALKVEWRGIREFLTAVNESDGQAEPVDDNGDATASPAPIAAAFDVVGGAR